ncbi:MAG: outer membrane protein assembly factor BamA [Deltaproteobacteria bacterium]|nr:outer membrane protein assembly factor BamA [Deltaproteobacteria bacterium]
MERSRLLPLLLAAALLLSGRGDSPASDNVVSPGEPLVASVSFRVASPYLISYEELSGLVAIRAGDRLGENAVRTSIRGLYAKSVFREVSAYVREEGGKAHLLFHLRPLPLVSDIEVAGAKRVPAARILAASRLRRGVAAGEKELTEAEEAIRAFLAGKGFPGAKVSLAATCSVANGSGKVRIDILEGPPAAVRSAAFPGAAFFTAERLDRIVGVERGKPHDFERWESGIVRLRREYRKSGFLTVHVTELAPRCDEGDEPFCPRAQVEEGPRYELRWIGLKEFDAGKVAAASGLEGEEEVSEGALVHDLRERVLAFYRERGYLRADVSVSSGVEAEGRVPLTVTVNEGRRGYIKEIRFEGNRGLGTKDLLRQMATRERGFFHRVTGSGKFSDDAWNDDLNALTGLYQKNGYARMRILGVDDKVDDRGGVTKTVRIDEGSRYRLREIVFQGNDHFLRSELLRLIRNREGAFVDYASMDADQEAVAVHYRNDGYLDAVVEAKLLFDPDGDGTVMRFEIREGPRYRLGNVLVRGTALTKATVVLRENPILPGGAAGEKALLSFQQSVYGTGLFKSVRLQRVKRPDDGILDLVVEVEEAMFFEVEFGGGFGTDTGVRGLLGAKEKNLDGLGRSLTGQAMVSQKEQKFIGDFREPYILGNRWKWEGGLTGSYQKAERRSFSLRKASLVASINQKFFERSSVSLQYELSRDQVFDVAPGAVLSPEDQGQATIAAVRGLVALDFRDDPFNPRKGVFLSGLAELASLPLGSEVDYYKLSGQTAFYFPVFRKNTFVLSGRAGAIRSYGSTEEVPIQKRFFLGGRTTVRGFREESLGPKAADGTPTGGDYMLNINTELRVPIRYGFLGALFVDAGSVWIHGAPLSGFDLRESAGAGLRYLTPVGPISLDYGWKLDRRPGETPSEWHFTIGAVF